MNVSDFIEKFRTIFEDGISLNLTPATNFRDLEPWDSLAVLGLMSMIDMEYEAQITPAELRGAHSLQDLFLLVQAKINKA
jgi:acyl carrier protein